MRAMSAPAASFHCLPPAFPRYFPRWKPTIRVLLFLSIQKKTRYLHVWLMNEAHTGGWTIIIGARYVCIRCLRQSGGWKKIGGRVVKGGAGILTNLLCKPTVHLLLIIC
jgi:hypothetical protein